VQKIADDDNKRRNADLLRLAFGSRVSVCQRGCTATASPPTGAAVKLFSRSDSLADLAGVVASMEPV